MDRPRQHAGASTPALAPAPKTFRIRGIPASWDETRLSRYLQVYDSSFSSEIEHLTSLALELNGLKVATVTFRTVPLPLKEHTDRSGRCSWTLKDESWKRQAGEPHPPQITIDDGFIGITTLHAPSERQHKLNIVAISGLGGHAFGSFKERGGEYMWVRDSLPKHMPTARIMIYGYDSTVPGSKSMQTIEDLANTFRESLLELCKGPVTRPLIFIAHSLGGLILKQTVISLSKSKSSLEQHKRLLRSIYGLLLFGVPQDGMDNDSLIDMAGDGPNLALIESLSQHNSEILARQRKEFAPALGGEGESELFCFYETLKSPTAMKNGNVWKMNGPEKILVTKESATCYRPWESGSEHTCSIHRNHSALVKFAPNDPEYDLVRQRLQSVAERGLSRWNKGSVAGTSSRAYYHLPLTKNHRFIGRESALQQLEESFFRQRIPIAAIWGVGGVGKTQLALAFAHRFKTSHPDHSVFWVSATSRETLQQGYFGIAAALRIDETHVNPTAGVLQYLNSGTTAPWLIVVDDVDARNDVFGSYDNGMEWMHDCLPSNQRGLTLFTCRSKEIAGLCAAKGRTIELKEMGTEDAVTLLRSSVSQKWLLGDNNISGNFVKKLGGIPLAITLAAAYMEKHQVPILNYIDILRAEDSMLVSTNAAELEDKARPGQKTHTAGGVATTWMISFQALYRNNSAACGMLCSISCLEPQAVPLSALPSFDTESQTWAAIGTLRDYGLIEKRSDAAFDVHPMIHLSTRVWVHHFQLQGQRIDIRTWSRATARIRGSFDASFGCPEVDAELLRPLLPHAMRLLESEVLNSLDLREDKIKLGARVAWFMAKAGLPGAALHLAQRCRAWADHLPKYGQTRLEVKRTVALSHWAKSNYANAIEELKRLRVAVDMVHDVGHHLRIWTRTLLANCYIQRIQPDSAMKVMEECWEECSKLPFDHPDRLLAQKTRAGCLYGMGKFQEGVSHMRAALSAHRQTASLNDRTWLECQRNLATMTAIISDDEAVRRLREVVAIQTEVLPSDSPELLRSRSRLAQAQVAVGDTENSLTTLQCCVQTVHKKYSQDHKVRMEIMAAVGHVYAGTKDFEQAISSFEEFLSDYRDMPYVDPYTLINVQQGLAVALFEGRGDRKRALDILERADTKLARTLPENFPFRKALKSKMLKIKAG